MTVLNLRKFPTYGNVPKVDISFIAPTILTLTS